MLMESLIERLNVISDIMELSDLDTHALLRREIDTIEMCIEVIEKKIKDIPINDSKYCAYVKDQQIHKHAMNDLIIPYFLIIDKLS